MSTEVQVSESACRILAGLLEARTGQQLTLSRRWRIETALSSVVREGGLASLDELVTLLVVGREPALTARVVEALLNNETYFFRDRNPFDLLTAEALPILAERRRATRRIRIWSAGCSTGQEAYSLAMLFADDPDRWAGWTIDILATDVSTSVIERARAGVYSQFEVQRGLGVRQMIRWFEECDDGWRTAVALRRPVRFKVHNILDPTPPGGPLDIILCRNVLLYLCREKRALAFDRLSSALASDGWLMLGAGETVIGQTTKLVADTERRGLYKLAPVASDTSGIARRA
ncbi:MAG: protein-glutamate O-methyltransferase CheR [Sphingomicrobium sp.]